MITRLLMAHGLHGRHVHEPAPRAGQRADRPQRRADQRRRLRPSRSARSPTSRCVAGVRPSYFEAVTAAAFRWFADVAVDVAVVEVGLLGRWDATNVVDAQVAVVTNVGIDHTEFAGPTKSDIAREKAGHRQARQRGRARRDRPRSWSRSSTPRAARRSFVRGERLRRAREPARARRPRARPAHADDGLHRRVRPAARRHQADNAVVALDRGRGVLRRAGRRRRRRARASPTVEMPGRFEVLGHQPLVIVDGAHNPAGADTCRGRCSSRTSTRRAAGSWSSAACAGAIPARCSSALRADEFDVVLTCTAPSPRGMPAAELAAAASALGCDEVIEFADGRAGLRAGRSAGAGATTRSSSPARSTSSAPPALPAAHRLTSGSSSAQVSPV